MVTASEEWHGEEALIPGTRFGRYLIGRKVGSGGVGTVYEAQHIDLKKRVAIKVLSPWVADEPEVRLRFMREGESAARLRHPNVVDIYDVGHEGDITYLVMEFLEGINLSGLLRKHGRLMPSVIADILVPISSALHTAHEANVIHRDLKPSNIFLAQTSLGEVTPKLLDFGISKLLDEKDIDGITLTGTVLGTPSYMSPEQAHGGMDVDARSDQYSLGVIAYLCSTGHRPFSANSMYQVLHKIVRGEFQTPSELGFELPGSLENIILKAMATRSDDRFPTILDFGKAMMEFADPRLVSVWAPLFGLEGFDDEVASPRGAIRTSGAAWKAQQLLLASPPPPSPSWIRTPLGMSSVALVFSFLLGGVVWGASGGFDRTLPAPGVVSKTSVRAVNSGDVVSGTGDISVRKLADDAPAENSHKNVSEIRAPSVSSAPNVGQVAAILDKSRRSRRTQTDRDVKLSVSPEFADWTLDGENIGQGEIHISIPSDSRTHILTVSAPGYAPQRVVFTDVPPPHSHFELLPEKPLAPGALSESSNDDPVKGLEKPGRKSKRATKKIRSRRDIKKSAPKKGKNDALIIR